MRDISASQFRAGLVAILPAAIAVVPFALLLGANAAQKGLSPVEMGLMSALVFAGSSQFVAVDLWTHPAPWLTLGLTALLINLRHVLMSASLAGKLGALSRPGRMFAMFFLADEAWALAERRALAQPLTAGYLFGLMGLLYVNWLVWTVVGAILGSAIGNPASFGFDFAFTAIFIGLIASFWKGPRTAAVIAASGGVAALTYLLAEGPWYVLSGALAGMAVASLSVRSGEEVGAS